MNAEDPLCREIRRSDRTALVSLWARVFGDPPALVETFLDLLPEMGTGVLVEENGALLGAAYLLDGFTLLFPDAAPKKCGYLYAVAVEAHARGRGLGARLSQVAAGLGRSRGAEIICTLPAEASLYVWYNSVLSLRYVNRRVSYLSSPAPRRTPLSAEEYGLRREELLNGRSHVRLSPSALRFQWELCLCYGGGFYAVGDSIFCACSEENGLWRLQELLSPAGSPHPLGGLQAMESPYLCSDLPLPPDCVWNLTLD